MSAVIERELNALRDHLALNQLLDDHTRDEELNEAIHICYLKLGMLQIPAHLIVEGI